MKASIWLALSAIASTMVSVGAAQATAVTVGGYYQEGSDRESISPPTAGQCVGRSGCFLVFNTVAAGKQLLITDVSCSVTTIGAGADGVYNVELAAASAAGVMTDRAHHLTQTWKKIIAADNVAATFAATTRQLVKAGERPMMRFDALNNLNWGLKCSITGKIGNPPTE